MPIYGLEIRYNGNQPVRCFSHERGGVSVQLYTARDRQLRLDVSVKTAGGCKEYSLPALVPGDSLSFKFLHQGDLENDRRQNTMKKNASHL